MNILGQVLQVHDMLYERMRVVFYSALAGEENAQALKVNVGEKEMEVMVVCRPTGSIAKAPAAKKAAKKSPAKKKPYKRGGTKKK